MMANLLTKLLILLIILLATRLPEGVKKLGGINGYL
jgi:hypothetical protein